MTIREMRERAGLTQAELALRAGLSQPNISAYESGRRQPNATTIEKIRRATGPRPSELLERHRDEVLQIARRHHALSVRVFGSVARGQDHPGSDVDLLMEFDDATTLLDLSALVDELEELLQVSVDVVSAGGLRGAVGAEIASSAVPLAG